MVSPQKRGVKQGSSPLLTYNYFLFYILDIFEQIFVPFITQFHSLNRATHSTIVSNSKFITDTWQGFTAEEADEVNSNISWKVLCPFFG